MASNLFTVGKETNRFTFPAQTARLSESLVKELRLGPGLGRFGKRLIEQLSITGDKGMGSTEPVVGIQITGIEFVCCLEPKKG